MPLPSKRRRRLVGAFLFSLGVHLGLSLVLGGKRETRGPPSFIEIEILRGLPESEAGWGLGPGLGEGEEGLGSDVGAGIAAGLGASAETSAAAKPPEEPHASAESSAAAEPPEEPHASAESPAAAEPPEEPRASAESSLPPLSDVERFAGESLLDAGAAPLGSRSGGSETPGPSGQQGVKGGNRPRGGGGPIAGIGSGAGGDEIYARLQAHLRARSDRCYPNAARRRSTEGTVRLSFCVDDRGQPARLAIEESSGSSLLDDAARECVVRGAAPLPAPPGCVELAVPFRLR